MIFLFSRRIFQRLPLHLNVLNHQNVTILAKDFFKKNEESVKIYSDVGFSIIFAPILKVTWELSIGHKIAAINALLTNTIKYSLIFGKNEYLVCFAAKFVNT